MPPPLGLQASVAQQRLTLSSWCRCHGTLQSAHTGEQGTALFPRPNHRESGRRRAADFLVTTGYNRLITAAEASEGFLDPPKVVNPIFVHQSEVTGAVFVLIPEGLKSLPLQRLPLRKYHDKPRCNEEV